jgi:60 kDa SS-A/Ro ribonucleoprotein
MLLKYRKEINPDAKAIYVTLVPYGDKVTLADPKDPMSYDIAGFSSQTPKIISMIAEGLI